MQRQLAIKIIVIALIGIMILIPTSMVRYKVYERQGYLQQARAAVAESWTRPQTVMTPLLIIPYQAVTVDLSSDTNSRTSNRQTKKYALLLPDTMHADIEVSNNKIYKGIYEVPVFNSTLAVSGVFSPTRIQQRIDDVKQAAGFISIGTPFLSVHIADVRGIERAPNITVNNLGAIVNTGSGYGALSNGLHAELPTAVTLDTALNFSFSLALLGMGSLSFVQLADAATTNMHSDWPHPEFIGASLPVQRDISAAGFNAQWSATRYANNNIGLLERCVNAGVCNELLASASGVNFIEPVNVYLQSERSIKYAMLFVGLSFITFFIFEHMRQVRIHPIQYAFVGLAIAVFYLLLISLAEHIAFRWAYAIAVLCCTSLLLFYVRYMLRSLRSALVFSSMILALYGLLYVIVQAEDFALLMGSLLVFGVLAALMVVTRKIDWYNLTEAGPTVPDEP